MRVKEFHFCAMTLQRQCNPQLQRLQSIPIESLARFQDRWSLWRNDNEASPNKHVQA